ncbi:MAG: lytic transglycosylase domain-containing protein [Gammaproteobacteria bacterium]
MLTGTTALAQTPPDPELRRLLIEAANDSSSFEDRFDAEVWLTDMSGRLARQVPDTRERLKLLKQIHFEATHKGLYPELVLAVIDIESNFDRFAISSAGAIGLMQVMPFWLKEIGRPDDNLVNAQTNLRMGCTILKYYLDLENQDLIRGLARYNGSKGRRKYGDMVIDRLNRKWYRN